MEGDPKTTRQLAQNPITACASYLDLDSNKTAKTRKRTIRNLTTDWAFNDKELLT